MLSDMDGKVSIIIPTKNEREGIATCLDSILNQIYKNYEVIVVDGGSTDGTVEIVRSFAKRHPQRIRLLSYLRTGVA